MKKVILAAVLSVIHCTALVTPAGAQTRLRPDDAIRDPRLNAIRERLQSDHGSIRPLSTYLDVSGARPWGEERNFIYYALEGMLLEAGAEPVQSRRDAQFQLYLSSQSQLDRETNNIVETLTLTLTDMRAGGGQTIMRSNATLECRDTRRFSYHDLRCPMDREILVEIFLRLR